MSRTERGMCLMVWSKRIILNSCSCENRTESNTLSRGL